jgi:hypothetical protein
METNDNLLLFKNPKELTRFCTALRLAVKKRKKIPAFQLY